MLATALAVFYTVENWRGKRAWEKCRRGLEAKGEVLDWAAYIPEPVPDEENFFKAPNMQEWFVRKPASPSGHVPTSTAFSLPPGNPHGDVGVLDLSVMPLDSLPDPRSSNIVLRLDDPAARQHAARLVRDVLGPSAFGSQNNLLLGKAVEEVRARSVVLTAATLPTIKELSTLFPGNPATNVSWMPNVNNLRVEPAGSNRFRLVLKGPIYGAADYLAWTERLTADFNQVREALQRRFAKIEGNYDVPYAVPLPNFVTFRTVAQILAQRAQSYLLLGRSEDAWHELQLIYQLCEVLEGKPPGTPVTLVSAMIKVAVLGLYTSVVDDGLQLQAWREPELRAIQTQLRETDLLEALIVGARVERAGVCRTLDSTKPSDLARLFIAPDLRTSVGDKLAHSLSALALRCMPRGWFHQNMALGATLEQEWLGCIDPTKRLIVPHRSTEVVNRVAKSLARPTPYTFLVKKGIPNFDKALQTVARNQTLVNQAIMACALERYRLAEGQYPASLDVLVPRLTEEIPQDLIAGRPLNYRRTVAGGYLLYSIGWDEKDSGGVAGKSKEEGDWVWSRTDGS